MLITKRVELNINDDAISGPFSTVDAVSSVGFEMLTKLSKSGSIFWSDHSKRYYYGFQEISPRHAVNTPWYYGMPNPLDQCDVQYGRVRIYRYAQCLITLDSFSREAYLSHTMQHAFETATYIVHYFPDERMVPDVGYGYAPVLPKMLPTQADAISQYPQAHVRSYSDNGRVHVSTEKDITICLADAISLIMGDAPSTEFMARLCSKFPQALMAAYGPSLIAYDKDTTALSVAQSIQSLASIQSIEPPEAIRTYVDEGKVGRYTIVGGWGFNLLQQHGKDYQSAAIVDLALAHSGSPEVTRATMSSLIGSTLGAQQT